MERSGSDSRREQESHTSSNERFGQSGEQERGADTLPSVSNISRSQASPPANMVWIPGGSFLMGSNDFYPEERPVRRAMVEGFWMDVHPVTNAQFRDFVDATGYVTVAERTPNPRNYPGINPEQLVPGSLVFRRPSGPVDLRDYRAWWVYLPGAAWHCPEGPGSTIAGREHHPVVHVAYEDALAYAAWTGKALPTEAEWEFAARGGLEGATYVWGNEFAPGGRMMANTWQGDFPWQNLKIDGYEGTSPVGAFPPNGYGLFDMAGNVWEWTIDTYAPHGHTASDPPCCVEQQQAGSPDQIHDDKTDAQIEFKVVKGGSHLCAPNYCLRYRPAARQGLASDTSACHVGFRCVIRSK